MTIQEVGTLLGNEIAGRLTGFNYTESIEVLFIANTIVNNEVAKKKKADTTTPPTTTPPVTPTPTPTLEFQDNFSDNYILKDGQISPNKGWKLVYNGYGTVECKNGLMNMQPRPVNNTNNTSACLLLTEKTFTDFELTCNMKTVAHTRQGSPPKNWEVAWIFFRYNDKRPDGKPDKHHHFYFHPSINGMLEIGKKDYVAITGGLQTPDGVNHTCDQEQQQYLMTKENALPFALGKSYKVKLVVVGRNIKLWIDDKQLADITDDGTIGYDSASGKKPIGYPASETMLSGKVGLYCEDSFVQFDNVKISSITS